MIGIITTSRKRPKILQLYCAGIKRLMDEVGDIKAVCVGDAEHKEICESYEVAHIAQKNAPVTQKWNRGLQYMKEQNVDYVMIIGSDDIMSTDLMRKIMEASKTGVDVIGVRKIGFYASDGALAGRFKQLKRGAMFGVCKTVNRRIWDKVDWIGWPKNKNNGIDGQLHTHISRFTRSRRVVDGLVVDVKSSGSLNKFSFWNSKIKVNSDPKIFYNILSEEEFKILQEIHGNKQIRR